MYQDKPPIEEVMTLHHAGVGHDGIDKVNHLPQDSEHKLH